MSLVWYRGGGLVTPLDILEGIASEFPDEDKTPDIVTEEDI
ncbi:MAG: hypothetical protein ACR5K7_02825 [Symbiopectobacterium sp.]